MSALSPEGLALSMSNERKQSHDLPSRLKKALDSEDFSPRLKRALGHHRRFEIFIFLMDRPDEEGTSERELADVLDMGDRLVEYHLKVLQDVDLVADVTEERGLGTAEPSYIASVPHWLASSDESRLENND
jgi:DNA-binding transcriptional ArsR family regulator